MDSEKRDALIVEFAGEFMRAWFEKFPPVQKVPGDWDEKAEIESRVKAIVDAVKLDPGAFLK
jgi:hypothetical protein